MTAPSSRNALGRARAELESALGALQAERDRNTTLDDRLVSLAESYKETLDRQNRQCDVEKRRLQDQVRDLQRTFERRDVEHMTRPQLVSLIEQAINEARRKGLVEAEGLLSRHRELNDETDLEMMRGVVAAYQARIARVEELRSTRAAEKAAPVKLDGQKLADKYPTPSTTPAAVTFQAPRWWWVDTTKSQPSPSAHVAADTASVQSDFASFDKSVRERAENAKYAAFIDGQKKVVPGTSGGSYILSRTGSVYRCSCPAWTYSAQPAEKRTCKHLARYFGQDAETRRISNAKPAPSTPTHCWCGAQLIRLQCPEHTQDWKGEELCECGRKFASCKAAHNTISIAQRTKGHQPKLARSNGTRW